MVVSYCVYIVRGGQPCVRARGMVVSRSVEMIMHPRGSCIVYSLLCLDTVTHHKTNEVIQSYHPCASKYAEGAEVRLANGFLVGCSPRFMRLAERLVALRARCKTCLFGRFKNPTCSVPASQECEDLIHIVIKLPPFMISSAP